MMVKTACVAAYVAVWAAAASLAAPAAYAQAWPAKTVRIVVPQPPGGTTDLLARLLAKKYTDTLAQSFVVENSAGASGIIGTEAVVRSPADGYTLLFTSASLSVSTAIYASKLNFDPLASYEFIGLYAEAPMLIMARYASGSSTVS